MEKMRSRLLSLALALVLALSLLPGAALGANAPASQADDTRTVITSVSATTETPITPQLGEPCVKVIHFTRPEGVPYTYPDSMGLWFYNGSMINHDTVFRPGTWQYRKQVRIDPPEAADYRLPCGDESLLTGTVNGEAWSVQTNRPWNSAYTTADLYSPEYVLTAAPGTPLTFADDPGFDSRLTTTYRDRSITAFSVADHVWGGTEPYSFYKASGPAWLVVSQDGTVSGSPNRVGDNDELVIRVVDGAGAEASIAIAVGHTWMNPNERTVVSEITATADLVGLQPVPGENAAYLPLTLPEDAPYHVLTGHWCIPQENGNGYFQAGTFEEGREYRYYAQFQINDDAIREYRFSRDDCTVKVNGVEWEVSTVVVQDGVSYAVVYSPAVTCSGIIFTLQSVTIDGSQYPFDGLFYGTDNYYAYRFTVDVLGEENDNCTITLSGSQGGTSYQGPYSNSFNLRLSNEQTQPLTVNAVSAADPSKTASFTIVPSPRPPVTLVEVCWDPAQLRLSEEMDIYAACSLFRSLMQRIGEIPNPYGFPMGDQAYGQLRYCGVTYRKANGRYNMLTDSPDHTPLDADETYYIAIDVNATWPYLRDPDAPPQVVHLKALGNGAYTQLETADEVVFDQNSCKAYFQLPSGTVTEKLWVEQATVSYDGDAACFYETMTGAEATAALRSAIDTEAGAGEQAAAIVDECYFARKVGDVFVDQTADASPLGSGEYYAVFVMEPQNGNSWNLALMTRETNPIWPGIGVDNGSAAVAPEYHWFLDEGDYTGRVAFAKRVNVVPACPAPGSASLSRFSYGMGLRFYWTSPGYIQEGNPVPTCYRAERKAGDGSWEFIGYWDYEADGVGQNHGYTYDDTDVTEDVSYTYRVRSENGTACSPWLTSTSMTPIWRAPGNFTASSASTAQRGLSVELNWRAPEGAVTYSVYRVSSAATPASIWPATSLFNDLEPIAAGLTEPTFTDTDVEIGTWYAYRVKAHNPAGESQLAVSGIRNTKIQVTQPSPPTGLAAALDCGAITLSWDQVPGALSYWIERDLNTGDFTTLDSMHAQNCFTDTAQPASAGSTLHSYRVRAVFAGEQYSEPAIVNIDVPPLPNGMISCGINNTEELYEGYSGESGIYIWMTCYDSSSGIHIYRCEEGESDFLLLGTTSSGYSTWVDTTALPGRVYRYKLAPFNDAGEHVSPFITEAITRTPAAPEWVTAYAQPGRVLLSWAPVEGADGYKVAIRDAGSTSTMVLHSGLLTETSFVAEDYMDPGSRYDFAVVTYKNDKYSANTFSNVITARAAALTPDDIVSVTAAGTAGKIIVSWPEAARATRYAVARQASGSSGWTSLSSAVTAGSYVDTDVTVGTSYRYRVRAYNDHGSGGAANSNYAAALEASKPGDIASVTAVGAAGKITVSWPAAEYADRYVVARQASGSSGWTTLSSAVTAGSYVDTDVTVGTSYRYRVRAYNDQGSGGAANSNYAAALAAKPGDIASVTALASAGKITVSWPAAEYATRYAVARQTYGSSSWTSLTTTATEASFVDSTAVAGTQYRYRVRAYNDLGSGAAADSNYAAALAAKPAAIESVTAAAAPGKITVSWPAAEYASRYAVARQTYGSASWTSLTTSATEASFVDTTAVAGTQYRYRVRAYNDLGSGAAADSNYATALAAKPAAIESVTATASPGKITVTWPAAEYATRYAVARQTYGSSSWSSLTTTATETSFVDSTAVASTQYRYRVRAYNDAGSGAAADSDYVTALAAKPGNIASVTAAATPGKITVSWPAAEYATRYAVARQTYGSNSWTSLTTTATETSFVDSTAVAGTQYRYRVRAYNSAGSGAAADSDYVTALAAKPGDIASVTALASAGKITVSWPAAEYAARYVVARQTYGSSSWSALDSNVTATSFVDSTAVAGTQYRYRVRAYNSAGSGAAADSAYVTALAAPTAPPANIASVTALASAGKITVSWPAAENAARYVVARQTYGSSSWTILASDVTANTYADSTAAAGTKYRYRIRAYNDLGSGGAANSAYVTAK